MNKIPFTKMHGNGNDFIVIDEFERELVSDQNKADFSYRFCDRHFGIGADGVLFLSKSSRTDFADIKMRLFQPDRSEAEMCGNGICCLVKHACDKKYVLFGSVTVETVAGILTVKVIKNGKNGKIFINVNMGKVKFGRKDIPAKGDGTFLEEKMHGYKVSAVNTGVPHSVIFVDNLDIPLKEIAQKIRFDPVFPEGSNVNLVLVKNNSLRIRTYERGVEEETLSCGTGSVASAVIARRLGKIEYKGSEKTLVKTNGGSLSISEENDCAYMESTAKTVYNGTIELSPAGF